MSATGYRRGHRITWDGADWRYDDGSLADHDRPCPKCGEMPTPEGYDACLDHVEGLTSACCGHGVESAYRRAQPDEPSAVLVLRDAAVAYVEIDDDLPDVKPEDTPTERWDAAMAEWQRRRDRLDAALADTEQAATEARQQIEREAVEREHVRLADGLCDCNSLVRPVDVHHRKCASKPLRALLASAEGEK